MIGTDNIAYIAGLFDGEGSLHIKRSPEKKKTHNGNGYRMSNSMRISMEIAMNFADYFLTGGAILTWWVVPLMLIVGFLTPWPYNYWRLKKYGINCH